MKLAPNWTTLLKRAWSIRLIAVAVLLSGVEAAAPYFDQILPFPPSSLALVTFAVSAAALIARLVAQKGITDEHS
jgi:hypothetical protein